MQLEIDYREVMGKIYAFLGYNKSGIILPQQIYKTLGCSTSEDAKLILSELEQAGFLTRDNHTQQSTLGTLKNGWFITDEGLSLIRK